MAAVGSVEQGLERQADAARVEGELAQMGTEGAMGLYRAQEYGSPGGVISLETLNQPYGRWGSPWGVVPPELDAHLRSLTGYDRAMMYKMARGEDAYAGYSGQHFASAQPGIKRPTSVSAPRVGGAGDVSAPAMSGGFSGPDPPPQWPTSAKAAIAPGIQLVEERPGKWIWTGWQDDPEYRAYIEGVSSQRQAAARGRLTEGAPHWSTQLLQRREGQEATQIADLFGALGVQEPKQRLGQTEATGGAPFGGGPSSAGYLGMESARQAPASKRSGFYSPKGSE